LDNQAPTPGNRSTVLRVLDLVRRIVPSAVSVLPRTGGQQNTVYEVHRPEPEPPLIVKVYASESRWWQAKEVHVYRMLADHGVGPAPRVLDVRTDGLTLMTLLPGRMLSEVDDVDTRRIYRQLGRIMAEMHSITQDAYGYLTTRILDPEPTNSAYMTRQFAAKLDEFASLGGEPALHAAMEAVSHQRRTCSSTARDLCCATTTCTKATSWSPPVRTAGTSPGSWTWRTPSPRTR
jgi:aminoglycoside phosphotransferase (APT) family kinase protein